MMFVSVSSIKKRTKLMIGESNFTYPVYKLLVDFSEF